jgi:nucleoid DNA-binding protein
LDILYQIKDLLLSRDGLVIPGLGSIVVDYLPAEIDRKNNQILPPRRKYTFNPTIKTDADNILANQLVKEYKISNEEAEKEIKQFVEQVKKALSENREFMFEGIGKLLQDDKGKLVFQEEEKLMGMDPLSAEPFELEGQESPTTTTTRKTPLQTSPPRKKRKTTRYLTLIAVFLILLFVGAGLYTGFFTFYIEKFTKKPVAETEKPGNTPQQKKDAPADTTAARLDQTIHKMTDKKRALMYEEPAVKREYHLITGSFKRRVNAEEFQTKLKKDGFSSRILEKDGLFRVSVQSFSSKEDALVSLYHMRDTTPYKSVWLLTVSEKVQ